MSRLIDLTGKTFGRLTVVARHGEGLPVKWLCKCDCGNNKIVLGSQLRTGKTKSCGCIKREQTIKMNTTHGLSGHPLYKRWKDMRARCENENNKFYRKYGGRGIYVCEEWQEFVCFYDWSTANGFDKSLVIDRVDNDGPYAPWNCRWVTVGINNRNSTNAKFTWNEVREIKARISSGESPYVISNDYNCAFSAIYRIANGETWKE